jgi:hypothetical protein
MLHSTSTQRIIIKADIHLFQPQSLISRPHLVNRLKMPSITKSLLLLAALQAFTTLAAPIPQLAGEGAACNSVLSSTDNGVGYGVENAEGMSSQGR